MSKHDARPCYCGPAAMLAHGKKSFSGFRIAILCFSIGHMMIRPILTALFLAVLAVAASPALAQPASPMPHAVLLAQASQIDSIEVAKLPAEARATLDLIKRGGPFPYSKDGTVFGNREGLLPRKPRGYYTEYTVDTPGAKDRGARRIVAGGEPKQSGEYYYTGDHYRSFMRIRE